jgi:hypothetical protein
MQYSTCLTAVLLPLLLNDPKIQEILNGSSEGTLKQEVADLCGRFAEAAIQDCLEFLSRPIHPEGTFDFERRLGESVRELARQVVQAVYNHAEPAVESLPKHVNFESSLYTRLNQKTPQPVWTLFGQIRLERIGYRPSDKAGDAMIFPLALALGLSAGASPALAERAAGLMSDAGATQQTVLKRLKQDHGVGWGVKKLRQVTAAVSGALAEQRQPAQVERLLELLRQAKDSRGGHKPVLSVGRDGITLGMRCQGGTVHEVASCGTITVLDRRGRRLGTVYLGYVPEFGQGTLSKQLTALIQEVLRRWQDPLPRLCYVTDSGDNETSYYAKVLSRMKHPRTGEKLNWQRVADYYHASERVWTMAELLFGKGQKATAWVRKMQKWLLKPAGVNRVLHSAAALRQQQGLRGKKLQDFGKAYRYLRDRMRYMDYASYRRLGIPLGSGVTEAACKTVFTQRLKLSGMRWLKAGAQCILELRVLRLSGVWDVAYRGILRKMTQPEVWGQAENPSKTSRKAV